MPNGKCSITLPNGERCQKDKVAYVKFENDETGELVTELDLCQEHGEMMRKAYFPKAPPLGNHPEK